MADGNIKLYGKLKSVTEEGKVVDYSEIAGVPIIMQDLNASGFTPTANTYYLHIGETTITCDKGTIYFYNGTNYTSIIGGGSSINVVQTTGGSTVDVMSQKTVTDIVNNLTSRINELENTITKDGYTVMLIKNEEGSV